MGIKYFEVVDQIIIKRLPSLVVRGFKWEGVGFVYKGLSPCRQYLPFLYLKDC